MEDSVRADVCLLSEMLPLKDKIQSFQVIFMLNVEIPNYSSSYPMSILV